MNQNQIKKYTSGSSFTCTVSVVISLIHLDLLASNLQTSDYYEMALFNESKPCGTTSVVQFTNK